jgi:hypothetical protein
MTPRLWTGLHAAVADGHACVICGRSLRFRRAGWIPVGHAPNGLPVFACVGHCAQQATATPPTVVPIPEEALTAGGIALLAIRDRAKGDLNQAHPDDLVADTIHAATPIIVATELRRIATELRARADALDPLGRERDKAGEAAPLTADGESEWW